MHQMTKFRQDQIKQTVREVVTHYGKVRTELVTMLHAITEELGYLPNQAFAEIALEMDLPVGEVYSVASFYTMLLTEPRGRHLVLFCESAPCHIAGSKSLLTHLTDAMGVQPGETSEDGRWTLLMTSCLGQCARGPVVVVDDEIYGPVTAENLPDILGRYE